MKDQEARPSAEDSSLKNLKLSKYSKRQLSEFQGHELAYAYSIGNLDDERKKAFEARLQVDKELQSDLKKIEAATHYSRQLGMIQIHNEVVDEVNAPDTYLAVILKKTNFEKWPIGIKWGMEALLVVSALVVVLTIAPWEKAMQWSFSPSNKELVLAEVSREQKIGDPDKLKEMEKTEPAQFSDEIVKKSDGNEPTKEIAANNLPKNSEPTKAIAKNETAIEQKTNQVASALVGKTTNSTQSNLPSEVKPLAKTETKAADKNEKAEARVGYLYRGGISITNLEAVGPKITDKILGLGGRKAGDVDLGWRKSQSSIYFHFTIPEAKYDELVTFLSQYGKPKLSKERHSRVMPDGIIRLIITVDEAK